MLFINHTFSNMPQSCSYIDLLLDTHSTKEESVKGNLIIAIGSNGNFLSGGDSQADITPGFDIMIRLKPLIHRGGDGLDKESIDVRKCMYIPIS